MRPSLAQVEADIARILREQTADWDLDIDEIGPQTRLSEDLCFTSVDALNLMAAIDVTYRRRLNYEALIIADGRYVEDLSLAQVARFVHENFEATVGDEPSAM